MTGAVTIMLRLGPKKKAVQPFVLTDGIDLLGPSGEHLVDVSLVGNVKEELVFGRIENPVKGDAEFDHSEVGAEMSPGIGKGIDESVANFASQSRELFGGEILKVVGAADLPEKGVFRRV